MARCPKCSGTIGFHLRFAYSPIGYARDGDFRCPHCGIRLGYRGLRSILAVLLQLGPIMAVFYFLSLMPRVPPDLPLWLVFIGVVTGAAGFIFFCLVVATVVPMLLPAQVLPQESSFHSSGASATELSDAQRRFKMLSALVLGVGIVLVSIVTWKASGADPIRAVHIFLPALLWLGVLALAIALRHAYRKLDNAAIDKHDLK